MKCSFCDREFDEVAARRQCSNCTMFGGCRNVRCPHCGAEAPEEPGVVKWLRKKLTTHKGAGRRHE